MAKLKTQILEALQDGSLLEGIFDKLMAAQENLMKNYSNPVFDEKDRQKLSEKYSDVEKIGKSLYKYNTYLANNMSENAAEESGEISDYVLKGGISNVKYVWHSEKGENTCDECKALDGTEYEWDEEVPERPHPNCKCTVEVVEDNNAGVKEQKKSDDPCDCLNYFDAEFKIMVLQALILREQMSSMIDLLVEKVNLIKEEGYKYNGKRIIDEAAKWDNAAGDFARNYNDMLEANTINGDKYFHSKANCQATQRGGAGEVIAEGISLWRELEEGYRKIRGEGVNWVTQVEDALADMEANKFGRQQGRKYPDNKCRDLVNPLRPNGLPEKY